MTDQPDYKNALRSVALRQMAVLLTFLGFAPYVVLARWLTGERIDVLWFVLPYAGLYLLTIIQLKRAKCPRCDEPYFAVHYLGMSGVNPFARRCAHCGLEMPKYQM